VFPALFRTQILRGAKESEDEYWKARGFASLLLAIFPLKQMRERVAQDALQLTRAIKTEKKRSVALSCLIPCLPAELLPQAFSIVQSLQEARDRVEPLMAIVRTGNEPLLSQAVEETVNAARLSGDPLSRGETLAWLAVVAPEHLRQDIDREAQASLEEAWQVARAIDAPGYRGRALLKVLPLVASSLRKQVVAEVLEAAGRIESTTPGSEITWQTERVDLVTSLIPYLSDSELWQALNLVRAAGDEESRKQTLAALGPFVPEELVEACLTAARELRRPEDRVQALRALLPRLSGAVQESVFREAVETGRSLVGVWWVYALLGMSADAPEAMRETLVNEALASSRRLQKTTDLAKALAEVASYLADPHRQELLAEALQTAGRVEEPSERVSVLCELAQHLTPAQLREVIETLPGSLAPEQQAVALAWLLPHLPEKPLQQALQSARAIRDPRARALAFCGLACHFRDNEKGAIWQEALAAAELAAPTERPRIKADLLSYLQDDTRDRVCEEVLASVSSMDGLAKDLTVGQVARYAPVRLLGPALRMTRQTQLGAGVRRLVFPRMAARLAGAPREVLTALWLEVQGDANLLHYLSRWSRLELLSYLSFLAEAIFVMGGEKAVAEVFHAVVDTGRWWP